MRITQDVKAQQDFIIQAQIQCLLDQRKACARIFDSAAFDKYTQEYLRLEAELKKLTDPISPSSEVEPSPTEEIVMVPPELS